jgi:hypothetical protein
MTEWFTSAEAAKYLGLSPSDMKSRRCRGTLPIPFLKTGKRGVRYKKEDLDAFIAERTIIPKKKPAEGETSDGPRKEGTRDAHCS